MNEEKLKKLIHDVYDNVAAYREFIKEMTGSDSLPVNLNVEVVALGALPRNTTSGKIKKLIDKRVL